VPPFWLFHFSHSLTQFDSRCERIGLFTLFVYVMPKESNIIDHDLIGHVLFICIKIYLCIVF